MRHLLLPIISVFLWQPSFARDQTDAECMLQVQPSLVTSATIVADNDHNDVLLMQADATHVVKNTEMSLSFLQTLWRSTPNQHTVVASAAGVLGLGLAFVIAGTFLPSIPRPMVSVFVIIVYISLSVTIDLLIMYQKDSGAQGAATYKFDPTCSIILTETMKLFFSLTLYTTNQLVSGSRLLPEVLSLSDVWLFLFPALFFTANNIMVFVAIGGNDASAFGVFRDTMILWTALIWVSVFRASLGPFRLGGIAVIFLGLVVNRVASISLATFNWAFLLVMLMTVTNATGSVLNEYALKFNKDLDINLQNAILYAMCITFSIIILAVRSPVHLTSVSAFFEGFTNWTVLMICLQSSAGLLVSRLLKYADSIYKTIGTCLRGPMLVIVAPVMLGSTQDYISLFSSFIVASGCLAYLSQGPLTAAPKASDKAEATDKVLK